jgi:hypothetical protein
MNISEVVSKDRTGATATTCRYLPPDADGTARCRMPALGKLVTTVSFRGLRGDFGHVE